MGLEIDNIYWKARLDIDQLKKDIKNATTRLDAMDNQVKKQASGWEGMFKKAGLALAGVFTVGALAGFGRAIVNIRGEFQKYEAVLTNTLGSGSRAQQALNNITEFASKTPFQVTELTSSFVKLANQGFTPTLEDMRKMGDLASSVGKSFDQLTEGILDAMMGEWERMKEFGIKARQEGDKVKISFKGQTTEIQNTASAVREYLISLGDLKGVSGAMEGISKTFVGQISNMKDSWDMFLNTLGGRTEGVFFSVVKGINYLIESLTKLAKTEKMAKDEAIQSNISYQIAENQKEIDRYTQDLIKLGYDAGEARQKAMDTYMKELEQRMKNAEDRANQVKQELYDVETEWGGESGLKFHWSTKELTDKRAEKEEADKRANELRAQFESIQAQYTSEQQTIEANLKREKEAKEIAAKEAREKELQDYQDNLNKMKSMYDAYEQAKLTHGQDFADKYYNDLKKKGDSYFEYLKKQAFGTTDKEKKTMIGDRLMGAFLQEMPIQLEAIQSKYLGNLLKTGNVEADHLKTRRDDLKLSTEKTRELEKQKKIIDAILKKEQERQEKEKFQKTPEYQQEQLYKLQDALFAVSDIFGSFSGLFNENLTGLQNGLNTMTQSISQLRFSSDKAEQDQSVYASFLTFLVNWARDFGAWIEERKSMELEYQLALVQSRLDQLNRSLNDIDTKTGIEKIEAYQEAVVLLRANMSSLASQVAQVTIGDKISFGLTKEQIDQQILFWEGYAAGGNKQDKERAARQLEMLNDLRTLLDQEAELWAAFQQELTGTTSSAISDSISDGFADGLSSAQDFGDKVNDIIKTAMLKSFQLNYLDKEIQKWYDDFALDVETGGLSELEITTDKANLNKIIETANAAWQVQKEMLEELGIFTSDTSTEQKGLAGAIKGITEDTAGLIAGQMGAIRINVLEQLEIARNQLTYMKEIALNTRRLQSIDKNIETLAAGRSINSDRAYGR